MKLIDRISPCLTNNPRQQLIDCSTDAVDWQENFYYLIGGLIAKYEKEPNAAKLVKKDLQSAIFELQSVVNGIH
jgi:hypothetical protein